jgi:PIN domain nuclease of toxin-antitoxin system
VGRSVIILDTHSWIWWVSEPERLTEQQRSATANSENDSLGISAVSCWEIAKLVERGRIDLDRGVAQRGFVISRRKIDRSHARDRSGVDPTARQLSS